MAARRIAAALAALGMLLLAAPAQATPPQPPLVTNGDFENATLSPWISYAGIVTLADQTNWTAASGQQSVELKSDGRIYQDIATDTTKRYDLSFAYAGNPAAGCDPAKTLDVSWNGTLLGYGAGRARFGFDTTGHTTAGMGWQGAHLLVDPASASTQPSFGDYQDYDCG